MYKIEFGTANVKRIGSDIKFVATSYIAHKVLSFADKLKEEYISIK